MSIAKIIPFLFLINFSYAKSLGVERINFFPDSKAFLTADYTYSRLNIDTDKQLINTKAVNNYSNLMQLHYAYKFSRKLFIGVGVGVEHASENAAINSVPMNRRSSSSGLTNPKVFLIYRLRVQHQDKGSVDLLFSYSPTLGPRKISSRYSNRYSGRNISHLLLRNGFQEERWEFQNLLGASYFSDGEERNAYLSTTFERENSFHVNYTFTAQYLVREPWYVGGSFGINYLSSEVTRDRQGEIYELRSGTESIFKGFLKVTFSSWSMAEISYKLKRREYFIKADTFNIDGRLTFDEFSLKYSVLF